MYTQLEIDKALQLYEQIHSIRKVVKRLGYPSKAQLELWLKEKRLTGQVMPKNKWSTADIQALREAAVSCFVKHHRNYSATLNELGYAVSRATLYRWQKECFPEPREKTLVEESTQPIQHSLEIKKQAVEAMRLSGQSVIRIAREFGVSRKTLYDWDQELASTLGVLPMTRTRRRGTNGDKTVQSATDVSLKQAFKKVAELEKLVNQLTTESEALQKEIHHLRLQKDVLVKAAECLKKEQGVNLQSLNNREKTIVIDALGSQYKLGDLLGYLGLAKSSYFYQKKSLAQVDKYQNLKHLIKEIFNENHQCYGYRRIRMALNRKGIVASEKVIRRLMKSEHLRVYVPRIKRFSSYQGEISPDVPNLLQRNFHADKPNQKWLTDITEFSIPSGKVYLSPVIDCLDGLPVAWTVGTHPDEQLVNEMLLKATAQLKPGQRPIIHSDRGAHYRWTKWIALTESAGLQRSMSKKACSADNSACEGFFGRMKMEMFYGRSWFGVTLDELIDRINDYMKWYREKRLKLSLSGLSPMEFRRYNGIT